MFIFVISNNRSIPYGQGTTGIDANRRASKKRIEELRRSLELEKMRSRAFEKMIEIAEQEEGISILKKRWCQTVTALREEYPGESVATLCGLFGKNANGIMPT